MNGELADHLREILRYRWLILGVAALAGLAGWSWRASSAPMYQSTAVVQVIVLDNDGNDDGTVTDFRSRTLAELATTPAILVDAVALSGLAIDADEAADLVRIELRDSAGFIEVTATGPTAEDAARLATAVVETLSGSVDNNAPEGNNDRLRIVVPAVASEAPVAQRALTLGALAAVVAAIVLAEGIVAMRVLSGRLSPVDAAADIERATGVPTIDVGHGARAAAFYRQNLANLPAFLVTATDGDAGMVGVGLARLAAGLHDRVLLIDAERLSPSLHLLLGLDRGPGLGELANGVEPLATVARPGPLGGRIAVVTAGSVGPAPGASLRQAIEQAVDTSGSDQSIIIDSLHDGQPESIDDWSVISDVVLAVDTTDQNRRATLRQIREIRGHGGRLSAVVLFNSERTHRTEDQ